MNPVFVHLALNHLPLGFVMVGLPLLVVALWRKSRELRVTAMVLLALAGIVTVPVYLSGEPAEEIAESLTGVSKSDIHEHEEAAEYALIWASLLGLAAFAGLAMEKLKGQSPRALRVALIIVGLLSLTTMVRTAHLGGLIRHPELNIQTSNLN